MDLVRDILFRLEATDGELDAESIEGHDSATVAGHLQLLKEAGLIEAHVLTFFGGKTLVKAQRLTWDGHEYLDAVRDAGVWAQTKRFIADKGGAATFAVTKAVAVRYVKEKLGLSIDD
jgi:DNA-binding PadR family transcriptional regulator